MLTVYHISDGKKFRGHGKDHDAEKKAEAYCRENGTRIIKVERSEKPFRGRVKDGIPDEPHFNNALGIVIRNKQHYFQVLKERGLVEIGNENFTPMDSRGYKSAGYFDEETLRDISCRYGIPISCNGGDRLVRLDKENKLHEGIEDQLED